MTSPLRKKPWKLTRKTPYFDLYVRFHSDTLGKEEGRQVVKSLLHFIHYGNCDTTEADAEVTRIRAERGIPAPPRVLDPVPPTPDQMRRAKEMVAEAAVSGIRQMLGTIRGCHYLGIQSSAHQCEDEKRAVQVACSVGGVPVTFEFIVRELQAC